MVTQVCVCCGKQDMRAVYEVRSFTIVRCHSCGLGQTILEKGFDFEKYYSEAYFQGNVDDGYADYIGSEDTLRSEFQHTLNYLTRRSKGRDSLLEFGCAYGFFLKEAAQCFREVEGIELSADAVRFCRSRGLHVTAGMVTEATLHGPYDAAVGLDVIEHVPEPHEVVRLIAQRLKPGGVLLLTTCDWGSLLARVMGPGWRLMTPPQHLSFFTEASISRLIERANLRVAEISHPWKQVPLSLVLYQLQRIIGISQRSMKTLSSVAFPINLWDAMRVLAIK